MSSCELTVIDPAGMKNRAKLDPMPTVNLLALSVHPGNDALAELIKACLAAGTVLFSTYGTLAEEMEDRIDRLLETESRLDIATTSHRNDGVDGTANFPMHAAFPNTGRFRCMLIPDKNMPDGRLLLDALEKRSRHLSRHGQGKPEPTEPPGQG